MTRPRGYAEIAVQEGGAQPRPLAQLPPEVPATDDQPTLCIVCNSELRTCRCSAKQRADANRIINHALAAGRDPAAALAIWRRTLR